jgi:predicted nucleic acid-binding protein
VAQYLADTSALVRMHQPDVLQRVEALYVNGRIATCWTVDLELLHSARDAEAHAALLIDRRFLPRVPCGDAVGDRAIEVQGLLARTGRHRVPTNDLALAAAAELSGLTVLHYDPDFDLISEVTGQRCEWVVPRGTVP